jgi:hypothetical protein
MRNIRKIISEALEISNEVPEDYKKDTFFIILSHLLKTLDKPVGDEEINLSVPSQGVDQSDSWLDWVVQNIPEPYEIARNGNRDQQTVWSVVMLHSRYKEAIVGTVQEIIRTELGITPQNRQNTGRQLRRLTPRFLIRRNRTEGKGYKYEPTTHSAEIFEGINE